jgi:uncharacterized membrane protein
MFCPSRLQQRMNEWAPAEEKDGLRSNTHSWDILLQFPNFRFIGQFLLLIFLLSLPLMWGIALHGQALDLLFLFGASVIAYSIGILYLPIGLHIPLLVYLVYPVKPQIYLIAQDLVRHILPPFSQVTRGLFVGILALIITTLFAAWLLKRKHFFLARDVIAVGGILSTLLGSWLATQNWYFALAATALIGLLVLSLVYTLTSDELEMSNVVVLVIVRVVPLVVAGVVGSIVGSIVGGVVPFAVATVVAIVVEGLVAVVVAIVFEGVVMVVGGTTVAVVVGTALGVGTTVVVGTTVAIVVESIATLPLPIFLLICWIIAASISPTMQNWLAIITAVMLTALGFEHQGWVSFLAVPVTLMSYYRLPDYLILTLIDFVLAILLVQPFEDRNPVRLLYLLPPYAPMPQQHWQLFRKCKPHRYQA